MRGVHVENLKPGQWVAIVGCRDEESGDEPKPRHYTGRPSRVVNVCPPFVCLCDGVVTESIDTRFWRLTKVTERYAKAVLTGRQEEPCPTCGRRDIYLSYDDHELIAECNSCDYADQAVSFWRKCRRTKERP